ncbi:hypothetical protein MPSEU_001040800 [Mayamaea pseudoterrestris]|nr:hypothetical protein MPSEU_001040800 [Mayamaea pseudoterrestris]
MEPKTIAALGRNEGGVVQNHHAAAATAAFADLNDSMTLNDTKKAGSPLSSTSNIAHSKEPSLSGQEEEQQQQQDISASHSAAAAAPEQSLGSTSSDLKAESDWLDEMAKEDGVNGVMGNGDDDAYKDEMEDFESSANHALDEDGRKLPASTAVTNPDDIIVLDDSDDDSDDDGASEQPDLKRQRVQSSASSSVAQLKPQQKPISVGAIQSHHHRRPSNLPPWMQQAVNALRTGYIVPGQSLSSHVHHQQQSDAIAAAERGAQEASVTNHPAAPSMHPTDNGISNANPFAATLQQPMPNAPLYMKLPSNFRPTWQHILPPTHASSLPRLADNHGSQLKRFQLSLLNVNEFSFMGLPVSSFDVRPTPISGMRVPIRQISRPYGKAEFEQDADGGKWRIPLGAYQPFYAYLCSLSNTRVEGISFRQLQIASLEKARQEKGYPTPEELIEKGVPSGLASALAPFQRGGVDFVLEKEGRALIADEMGLGKTIQGIAAIAAYRHEWPVLVLTPSSARYHWAAEFNNWLGADSEVNKADTNNQQLIRDGQVNVMTSSKDNMLPHPDTAVVICSYGLASLLVENKQIRPGRFCCAIVDESHMLKSKGSKRVKMLKPILAAANRCILLSGTPALAQPFELWPQLQILRAERFNGWDDEEDFISKYVRRCGPREKAELHTMLSSTVMIRRYKNDILKTMPKKRRAKAALHVLNYDNWIRFKELLVELRESKGQLGKLARDLEDNRSDGDTASPPHLPANQAGQLPPDLPDAYAGRCATARKHEQAFNEDNTDEKRRANVLSRLYCLTGDAKIPLVLDMLKRWLNDPTKGKLCIFAHHISVLDALQDLAGLSNEPASLNKYIRIDGSTNPKIRQEQIQAFQTDPSTKIALLGITAAGVAVTLTASSTVWFAELFWTPAIMIQAEDRCHRIGQNSRVNCLYFVAKGTLDEVLWMLLEKKFRELGEFVEGKEKQKIVVETQYNTLKELHSIFDRCDESDDDDYVGSSDFEKLTQDLQLDNDMVHDIELLGMEEQQMLAVNDEADDVEAEGIGSDITMPPKVETRGKCNSNMPASTGAPDVTLGTTEEEAICLDDSEDEGESGKYEPRAAASMHETAQGTAVVVDHNRAPMELQNCLFYSITIGDSSLGVSVGYYKGRIIVTEILSTRVDQKGQLRLKPAVGDILVSFNGQNLPILAGNAQFQVVCDSLRQALAQPPLHFIFAEDQAFGAWFADYHAKNEERNLAKKNSQAAHNVINLLDDND